MGDGQARCGCLRSLARTKAKRKLPAGTKTEGGGLGIPVESQVERLVLEDDDIVDD